MTTLKDYLRDLLADYTNHTLELNRELTKEEQEGMEQLLDDYLKMIVERIVGIEI